MEAELSEAADVAGGNQLGASLRDALGFALAELGRNLGMLEIVGAGRATADLGLGDLDQLNTFDLLK